jgi:hypothetical protein
LTRCVAADHCVGGAPALETDEDSLGRRPASTECRVVFRNHEILVSIIYMAENTSFKIYKYIIFGSAYPFSV